MQTLRRLEQPGAVPVVQADIGRFVFFAAALDNGRPTMKLTSKTRDEIAVALSGKSRAELLDIIYQLVTFEPLLSAGQIAAASKLNKREVLRDIKAGKFVDPVSGAGFFYRGSSSTRVGLSAANAWRRSFFVPVTFNRMQEAEK